MIEEQMNEMAEAFLRWPLPDDVCADAVACKAGAPHRTGTNLLTAHQALAMIRFVCRPELTSMYADVERLRAELAALRADAEIGQRWKRDNSLETWFPYTAEELVRLRAERDKLLGCRDELREIAKAISEPRIHNTMTIAECVKELQAQLAAERARAEADAAEAWRQVHLLKAEGGGPDGFATWKDAATDERLRRVKAEAERDALRERVARLVGAIEPVAKVHINRTGGNVGIAWRAIGIDGSLPALADGEVLYVLRTALEGK